MRIKISDALIYLTRDVISYKALQCFDLRWFCHNIKGESMLHIWEIEKCRLKTYVNYSNARAQEVAVIEMIFFIIRY